MPSIFSSLLRFIRAEASRTLLTPHASRHDTTAAPQTTPTVRRRIFFIGTTLFCAGREVVLIGVGVLVDADAHLLQVVSVFLFQRGMLHGAARQQAGEDCQPAEGSQNPRGREHLADPPPRQWCAATRSSAIVVFLPLL